MSPFLKTLFDSVKLPRTQEMQTLVQKIHAQEEIISQELSLEFLDHYTELCNHRGALEHAACFEQGFFACSQLFVEMLSRYSS